MPDEKPGLFKRFADAVRDNPVSEKAREIFHGRKDARPEDFELKQPPMLNFDPKRGGPTSGVWPQKQAAKKDTNLPAPSPSMASLRKAK